MVIGEDKSKVYNIVKDNIQHFRILYSNILRDCPQVVYKPQQGKLEVKRSTHTTDVSSKNSKVPNTAFTFNLSLLFYYLPKIHPQLADYVDSHLLYKPVLHWLDKITH